MNETSSAPVTEDFDDGPTIGLLDVLTWLGEGKRLVATVTVLAAIAAVAFALLRPNIFTARTTLLPPGAQQQSNSAAALAALGSLGGLAGGLAAKTPDELYVSLLKTDSVARALNERFDLMARYEVKTFEAFRRALPTFVRISSDRKSSVITIEVDDEDPAFAAELANAYVAEVTHVLGRLAVSEAQQRRQFFDKQLQETKENLVQAEQALRTVQEKSGMIVLDQQAEAIIKSVAELKARIVEREVQLRVLRSNATAENPDVQRLATELAALRRELSRMESSSGASPGGNGSVDIPVGNLPAAAVDYVRAMREMKFQESMLASMLRQYEIAKLDEAKDGPMLQQVDTAVAPDHKSKPARATIVLAATLAAFLLSCAWVVFRRYRQVCSEHDPESAAAWQRLAQAWRLRTPR